MTGQRGRPRDAELDEAILDATRTILSESGTDGVTFAAVAERAGTTRPALYRRFDDVDALVVAAIASLAASQPPTVTDDPYADLVTELAAFRSGITTVHGLGLVGSVLAGATTDDVTASYRESVVAPRRRRLREILDRAARSGLIDAPPRRRALLVSMCTGSWYALALAGDAPPRTWSNDTAESIWRAAGGQIS